LPVCAWRNRAWCVAVGRSADVTAVQSQTPHLPGRVAVGGRSGNERRLEDHAGSALRRTRRAYGSVRGVAGLLPVPPDDQEKYSYVARHLWVLVCGSLVSFGCLTVSQLGLMRSTPWLWALAPFLLFTVLYYVVSLSVSTFGRDFDVRAHRDLCSAWRPAVSPTVDVFLPVCGEPLEVVRNTWTHVARMAQYYQGVVTAYVLDDAGDPAIAAMAAEFGFLYGRRPNRGWLKKSGNLQYGFHRSFGEYVLILDADFAPRPDLLDELLPYMESDRRIAIVQSPQYFRVLNQQNWVERGAGAVQELFYRAVQVSRQRWDGAICVGSCAVYRRAALMENGGPTLIEHSEDVHTGFDLRRLGWDLRYVPIALSTGLCPDTVSAFQTQQYRWCAGSLSLLGSKRFWKTKLRLRTRLCYLSGFLYYIHTGLFTFVGPLIPIALLLGMPWTLRLENTKLIMPSVIYTVLLFPMWHKCPYRLEAWATRMMYGWAHAFAIWDGLRRRRMEWQPTGSSARQRNTQTRRFWIGITLWGGATAVVWVGAALWRMMTMYPPDYALVLSAGLFYATVVGRILLQPRKEKAA
jgi:cellulose synthase (UDP-forming)